MTKATEILEYLDKHPEATQADAASDLGFSRQIISYTLRGAGIQGRSARPMKRAKGPPCIYCKKEVRSSLRRDGKRVWCTYHSACAQRELRYQGNCPVCGEYFERIGSQVKSTVGAVACSTSCRLEAMRRWPLMRRVTREGSQESLTGDTKE